jgi:hypothetical protein
VSQPRSCTEGLPQIADLHTHKRSHTQTSQPNGEGTRPHAVMSHQDARLPWRMDESLDSGHYQSRWHARRKTVCAAGSHNEGVGLGYVTVTHRE